MNQNYHLEYDAFIRSIKRNIDSPHAFLLGAGASISSGIQSASDCIWEWKRDIFTTKNPTLAGLYNNFKTDSIRESIQQWLNQEGIYPAMNSIDEYSFYANKAYPIADDRRKYFQSLCEKKEPYVGYRLLMLLAEAEIVKSVWTTNFDGLVVKAAHQMNLTPIEITLDTVDRIYRNESRNELLSISLHGDFKYGELKNTDQELDNQNDIFVKTLTRYFIDKNLIIIGYSGRDKSLIDALKLVFKEKGAGRLYWCGLADTPNDNVTDLINIARNNNREAYYVSTDGFDKTLIHLAKSCFENNENMISKMKNIMKSTEDNVFSLSPFSLDITRTSKYLKSNLHPVAIPKEVFQFEIEFKQDEKPWALLRELTTGIDIACVPFKKKVYAISTKSLIHEAFKGRIKGDIIRVPITNNDVKNVTAFQELILNALLSGISQTNNLATDRKYKIWLPTVQSTNNSYSSPIKIHKAVRASLFFDNKYIYLSFKPDLQLQSESDITKEIKQSISKVYLEKLFNNKYSDELDFWNETLFKNSLRLQFEYPINSGSNLNCVVSKNSAHASIMVQNQNYNASTPQNLNSNLLIYKGVQYLEPELIFTSKSGQGNSKDFHPMRGLINNLPFDNSLNGKIFSNEVSLGVICPQKYSTRFYSFLNEINQKHQAGVNPDYLIDFPGFTTAYNIPINIPITDNDRWVDIATDHASGDIKEVSIGLARLITTKLDQIVSSHKQLVVTIFIPNEWEAYRKFEDQGEKFNLHDYIKAYAAQRGVSTQLIEEDTLADDLKCQKFWWLSLSFYVKSLRTPWVLSNLDKSTAFAGIGYSVNHVSANNHIVLGCSHIYNAQGQGLKYKLSRVEDFVLDRKSNPFLSYNDAFQFGVSICELFHSSIGDLPKRVVVHKRTPFKKDEINGIKNSLAIAGIEKVDLIEISFEQDVRFLATKVFNNQIQVDGFPLSRGTCIIVEPTIALLWTHGIVSSVRNPSYKYYLGGRSIPAPLKITKHYGDSNISTLATEILGLTKMNWNTFDLYTKFPATIESSNEIARIGNLLSRFEGKTYDYRFFI